MSGCGASGYQGTRVSLILTAALTLLAESEVMRSVVGIVNRVTDGRGLRLNVASNINVGCSEVQGRAARVRAACSGGSNVGVVW